MHILTLNSVTNLTTQVKSYNQTHQVSYASIPFLETTLLGPVVLLLHDGLFVLMTATRLHVDVILSVLPSRLSLSWLILLLQWTFFLWLLRRAVTSEYFLVYFHIWWIPFTLGWEFSGDSDGLKKKFTFNTGDLGLIPRLGRFPGGGNGNPLQYSCLENSIDRGGWQATLHGDHKELDTTELLTLSLGYKSKLEIIYSILKALFLHHLFTCCYVEVWCNQMPNLMKVTNTFSEIWNFLHQMSLVIYFTEK